MLSKQQLGAAGEHRARLHLESKGYEFVTRNFRTRAGEIDLVMRDGAVLVFVEVKTRRARHQGYPEEAVTWFKLRHTVQAAEAYCSGIAHRGPWRIDVVALSPDRIEHLRNVTATL